ncbi:Clavaminate synthase-like protein [Teratosphaeria nubilosa]|uniref:Clavaminate synthase-like protein n=1 Tax=Teratosphaeria nubilosa TaxID=161662 RepID=A0A6G1L4D4_9PEZI|nr:Clavaminate synthase-like protein [Teratosphaeria nubilosa]
MSSTEVFPVIDLSTTDDWPIILGDRIVEACKTWGFMILTGHGIPSASIDRMFELHKSFIAQAKEIKSEAMIDSRQIGYNSHRSIIGTADGMTIGGAKGEIIKGHNVPSWWDEKKRQEVEDFKTRAHALAMKLVEVFARSFGLPPDYFSEAHNDELGPGSILRMIHYPRLDIKLSADIPRCYAHTDWSTMAFVWPQSGGLEVETPSKRWMEVPLIPDSVVVNIGDAMSLWSGQTLKSTLHRVSFDKVPIDQERWSMVYFLNANTDAKLEVLKRDSHGKLKSGSDMPSLTMGKYHQVRMILTQGEEAKTKWIAQSNASAEAFQNYVSAVESIGIANGTGVVDLKA